MAYYINAVTCIKMNITVVLLLSFSKDGLCMVDERSTSQGLLYDVSISGTEEQGSSK